MPLPTPILHTLIETGQLTQDQAEGLHAEHLAQGKPIHSIAIEQGLISETQHLSAVAHLLGTEVIKLSSKSILPTLGKIVPAHLARMYRAVPVRMDDDTILFAVANWPSPADTDDMAFVLSKRVEYIVTTAAEVDAALLHLYGKESDSINQLLSSLKADPEDSSDLEAFNAEAMNLSDLEHAASATPVIRFVNLVLLQAVKDRASDIHFEPFKKEFKIRYRVDGSLFERSPPPQHLARPIISRIKVIAGLDIAESRLPQDGRIQLKVDGRMIDFRVSTLPTQFGESVVLRVLDRANIQLDIDHIGFPADLHRNFLEDLQKPNGIVIITGPTGSGKTTTLYAALQYVNQVDTKILTAEDPVEYDIEGIIQLPIHENIGLTFSTALRSFLRQDPDIIMVGEIRDLDTAQIAVQAALTGHLVFSTLHTTDAPGAITRLIDMEVEPYLIASTLEAVMSQRLVRTICPECKTAYSPDDTTLALLNLERRPIAGQPFYRGEGCEACNHTGYRGRRAIFEYMRINDTLRAAMIKRQPTLALRSKAVELGMRTLREEGIRCILDGYTTVEEIVQYT